MPEKESVRISPVHKATVNGTMVAMDDFELKKSL
jgi:hypothetical protein